MARNFENFFRNNFSSPESALFFIYFFKNLKLLSKIFFIVSLIPVGAI